MMTFEKNPQLDHAFRQIVDSMLDVDAYLSHVLDYVGKPINAPEEKALVRFLREFGIPVETLKYEAKVLKDNPYFKNIHFENMDSPTVRYQQDVIKKRTLINMDFHKPIGKYLFHYHPVGFFDEDVVLPVLTEGDRVWMSPAVSEIESMGIGYEKGHGHCLTLGLGIGVLPYLWLLKEDVKSVTVVEYNPDVIRLFDALLRPQFPTDKTLTVIQGNALDYYNEGFLTQFDYVYVDFWESSEDGLEAYTALMEKKVDLPHIDFWIEESILCDIQYMVAMYLLNLYEGRSVQEYIQSLDDGLRSYTKKVNRYFKTRDDVITTEEALLALLHSKEVLRAILGQR
jgi:CheY-like chemotaxis protein